MLHVGPLSHLILPLAGRVVQVGVAPVIVDSLLSLLVHPVELIGAVLHVVPQAQQVALTSGGIGLTKENERATTIFFDGSMICMSLKLVSNTNKIFKK